MKENNSHENHRQRMREDFKNTGFENWHEHKVLEYLLFRARPRVDTNELAHKLIDACGSFADVFRAPKEMLTGVPGIGKETAEYVREMGEFVRYYNGKRFDADRLVLGSENCKNYLLNLFDGKEREYFYMICLDARSRILYRDLIFEGSFESMDLDISKIIRLAVKCDASYVVLAHNHPSGIAKPSAADITSTQTVERVLQMCGIKLLDHIIVAGGKCAGMSKYLSP